MLEILVTDILNAFYVQSKKGTHEKMENRKTYGLSFCKSGEILYSKDGKTVLSNRNTAVILPKGQSYTICRRKPGLFPVINFECLRYEETEIRAFPVSDPEELMKFFFDLRKHLMAGQKLEALSIFYGMLSLLFESELKDFMGAASYIRENVRNPELTCEKLARHLKISQTYFNRKFKEVHGITPKQFLLQCRMETAKMLLRDDTMTISEIAEECGYASIYSFSRAFRDFTGLSPLHYRKTDKDGAY